LPMPCPGTTAPARLCAQPTGSAPPPALPASRLSPLVLTSLLAALLVVCGR
jgi:hypothetical protein